MTTLDLPYFRLSDIKCPARIVVIGSSGSGKSWLMRDILYDQRKKLPEGIVISGTVGSREDFKKYIPDTYIYDKYDSESVKLLLNNQSLKAEAKEKQGTPLSESTWQNGFLVLDDCLHGSKTWAKNEEMEYVFYNSRKDNLFFMLSMQNVLGLDSKLRPNISYVIFFQMNSVSDKKRIYEHYAGGLFPDLKTFERTVNKYAVDHHCIILDNVKQRVWRYKAKERKNFKVGSKLFWDFHRENYKKEEKRKLFDVRKKGKKPMW